MEADAGPLAPGDCGRVSRSPRTGWTSEAALAACVTAYLQRCGATVYPEVAIPGWEHYPDLVAIWRDGPGRMVGGTPINAHEIWIIETKLHLGLDIIAQGMAWNRHVHRTWLAVPPTASLGTAWQLGVRIAEREGMGLFVVSPDGRVAVASQAHLVWDPPSLGLPDLLTPAHEHYAVAGTRAARRLTPWAQTTDALAAVVARDPGLRMREYVTQVPHHYRDNGVAAHVLGRQAVQGAIAGITARRIGGVWRFFPTEG